MSDTTEYKKRWLSPDDLEQEYGFSKSTQSKMRMASSGSAIPFSKVGSKYVRYDRLLIDKWLEDHHVNQNISFKIDDVIKNLDFEEVMEYYGIAKVMEWVDGNSLIH